MEETIGCPLCEYHIPRNSYTFHLVSAHLDTLIAMVLIYIPEMDIGHLLHILNNYVDNYIESNNYEFLLDLCNIIGRHKTGIDDIQKICYLYSHYPDEERCPICLENLNQCNAVCTTIKCRHSFCKECLQKWIHEHNKCPICQQNLVIDDT